MKKFFSLIIAFAVILTVLIPMFSVGAIFDSGNVTKSLKSNIYYMQSLDDSTVLFEKNADKQTPPAAFVKVIAAIVAIEKWGDLDESVTITEQSLALVDYTEYGVKVAELNAGETYTKRNLIDCLIIYGANDVASVIAYGVSGSLDGFVSEMNTLVGKIGCTSTALKNITGFDIDGQYTTAKDVAKMMQYAKNYPVFTEASGASEVVMPASGENEERTYYGSNRMMNASISDYYHSSVIGGKQTSTDKAGECVAEISNKDGYSYITVVLQGKLTDIDNDEVNENTSMTDARTMLDWVYDNLRLRVVANENQTVATIKVSAGRGTDKVRLIPEKETSALVPSKATSASVLIEPIMDTLPEKLKAPVKAGDVVCQAKIYYAGEEITTINLVAGEDVSLSIIGMILSFLSSVVGSKLFLVFAIIAFLLAGGYMAIILKSYIEKKLKLQKKNTSRKK